MARLTRTSLLPVRMRVEVGRDVAIDEAVEAARLAAQRRRQRAAAGGGVGDDDFDAAFARPGACRSTSASPEGDDAYQQNAQQCPRLSVHFLSCRPIYWPVFFLHAKLAIFAICMQKLRIASAANPTGATPWLDSWQPAGIRLRGIVNQQTLERNHLAEHRRIAVHLALPLPLHSARGALRMDVQPLTYSQHGLSAAGRPQRQHRAGRAAARRVAPHRLLPDSRRPPSHHSDARRIAARADGFGRGNARVALVASRSRTPLLNVSLTWGVPEWRTSKPITWTRRPLRVIWHIATVIVAALRCCSPLSADAGPRRARLSSDLSAHLKSASSGDVDVIVSGSVEKIDAPGAASRPARSRRQLESGAVFSVSKQALDALSQDLEVESLSGNAMVHSHMALTTDITGADAAWAGADQVARQGQRQRHRRGDHRQRHCGGSSGAAEPRHRQRGLHRSRAAGPRLLRPRHAHRRHHRGAQLQATASTGADSGMAPAAHLINLKVLDANGTGEAADVIEAIDFAIKFRKQLGIRVINLSLGAAPTQSYKDDPLCQAVERAVKAGIVVVASAGNHGQTPDGKLVLRQRHLARHLALRDHGRRAAHAGHGGSERRRSGAVELEGSDDDRSHRQAGPGRARFEDRVDGGEGLDAGRRSSRIASSTAPARATTSR